VELAEPAPEATPQMKWHYRLLTRAARARVVGQDAEEHILNEILHLHQLRQTARRHVGELVK
jgi:hypothetical protein